MKRALIASTVLLTAVLAFLVFRRLTAHAPPAPPPAAEAAAHGEAARPDEHPKAEPAKAAPAALPEEAKPAEPTHAEPAKAAPAAHAEPPKAAPPAAAPEPKPEPRKTAAAAPKPKAKPRAERARPDEASAAAIFGDRPSSDGDGGRSKTPRIPVLRKASPGVAPPPHASPAVVAAARGGGHRVDLTTRAAAPDRGPALAVAVAGAAAPAPAQGPGSPGPPRLPGGLSGTLRDAAGGAIAGISVLAISAGGDDAFETSSDDDGFYLLAAMKPGRYLLFTGVGAPQAPTLPARSVEVPAARVARVDLRQPSAGATVRVRPVRADGRTVPGQVLLVAGPGPGPGSSTLAALLASDAIFLPEDADPSLLRRVPAGVYTMVLLGPGSAPVVARQPVTVRGDGDQVLDVLLPPAAP